jgi:hypothetical protein
MKRPPLGRNGSLQPLNPYTLPMLRFYSDPSVFFGVNVELLTLKWST